MSSYIVTYDLMQQGQNYTSIRAKLKAYGTWCHLQGSVWIIATAQTAMQIRDNLRACLDANDKLFVAKLTGEAGWIGHEKTVADWLHKNL
jgi:CRISPR/Cas system-associated endoribonuclease Cas2